MGRAMMVACAFLLLFGTCGGCRRQGGPRIIRLSHITSPGSAWDRGAKKFAELLEQHSHGRYKVQVYAGAQLAQHNQKTEIQQLCAGSIEMTLESPIILALFLDRRFDAFSLPWLFPDHAAANAVCDGAFGKRALGWLEAHGIHGIAYGVNGFRQLTNSVRAVRRPEDLEGMKVRVAGSDLFRAVFQAFGANPTTMNFGELFTALEQGAVQAQENPLSIIYSSKFYEVQKYCTVWNYAYDPIILTYNKSLWEQLPEADRKLITECGREAMEWERKLVEQEDRDLVAKLEAKGMKVTVLTPAEKQVFRKACAEVYRKFAPRIGEDVVRALRKAVERSAQSGGRENAGDGG
jgi:tripartite ATP-independent transporter DctP family solute receptor